jgi:predicted O-methyltransferase YrrM
VRPVTPITIAASDGHSADPETLHLLYGLVRYMRPSLVVEAGTYQGHATCAMAGAMRDAEIEGEVWSADIEDYGAAKAVTENGLDEWVRLCHGDFGEMLSGSLARRKWRLAFVDSGLVVGKDVTVPSNVRATHAMLAFNGLATRGLMMVDDAAGEWDGVESLRGNGIYLPTGRGLILVQHT